MLAWRDEIKLCPFEHGGQQVSPFSDPLGSSPETGSRRQFFQRPIYRALRFIYARYYHKVCDESIMHKLRGSKRRGTRSDPPWKSTITVTVLGPWALRDPTPCTPALRFPISGIWTAAMEHKRCTKDSSQCDGSATATMTPTVHGCPSQMHDALRRAIILWHFAHSSPRGRTGAAMSPPFPLSVDSAACRSWADP